MKFISKISKQGEDYFIRIPRDELNKHNELKGLYKDKVMFTVSVERTF